MHLEEAASSLLLISKGTRRSGPLRKNASGSFSVGEF